MKTFLELITEAKVNNKDIGKATELIVRYFSTQHNTKFREHGRISVSKYGKTDVIQNLYIDISNSSAIGVNWLNDGTFLGISMWDDFRGANTTPSKEIEIDGVKSNDMESFSKFLPKAVRMAYGEDIDDLDESVKINEAAVNWQYDGVTYRGLTNFIKGLYNDGLEETEAISTVADAQGDTSKSKFVSAAYKLITAGNDNIKASDVYSEINKGISKKTSNVRVVKGRNQIEQTTDEEEKADAILSKTKIADPEIVYKHLEAYTKSVADGSTTALLITGKGGTGKSFTVEKVLKDAVPGEWVKMKGRATARAMYMYLYNHYDKIVVFDDCDSIFQDPNGISILKSALDTSDDRKIGWLVADAVPTEGMNHEEIEMALVDAQRRPGQNLLPSEFGFEGQVIFISNLTLEHIRKKDSALLTRCQVIDVTLDAKGIISRMETILPKIRYYKARCVDGVKVEMTNEQDKKEVMEFLKTDEVQNALMAKGEEISMRTLIKACKLKSTLPDMWKDLIVHG